MREDVFDPITGEYNQDDWGTSYGAHAGIRDSTLHKHATAVAHALISRAQAKQEEGWVCWPSVGRLAADTGIGRSSVKVGLRALRSAGLVTWTSGGTRFEDGAIERFPSRYVCDFVAMEALRQPRKR